MEWSVHIRSAQDLDGDLTAERFATLESSARLGPVVTALARRIARLTPSARFTRCAFGTEFCENLLPPPAALAAVRAAARNRTLAFTFLTPYAGTAGIGKLRELFPLLHEGDEVVFSDWGVLNVLRREFPRLRPVQGRLLNKSLRDPRVMGLYASAPDPGGALAGNTLAALQRSNLDNESYTRLLARLGVAAVEMDNLPQGMDLSFADRGLAVTVYLPFGFISTSRSCMAAGLHYRKPDKFGPGAPCRHECQTHLLEYTYTNSPFPNRDQKFYLKGNTYFYAHSEPMLDALFEHAAGGRVSRLVFQPRLPMVES
ncbi:MAG: hypothetical protein HY238_10015 [Acidobacteria bacterium]|nr:hypothetical protein [Acidobacteriota bacterium]